MRQKFYSACNSLLKRSGVSELVKVQFLKSNYLPLLMYCIGGLFIKTCDILMLGVRCNNGFRTIFNMHHWESVKFVQFMCGDAPFEYLYDVARLKFFINYIHKCVLYITLAMYFCQSTTLCVKSLRSTVQIICMILSIILSLLYN